MKTDDILEYCTGCGLCNAILGVKITEDENGFCKVRKGQAFSETERSFFGQVCPAAGKRLEQTAG